MADGQVIYKIVGDNSEAKKALDDFEAAAKESGKSFEDTVEESAGNAETAIVSAADKIAKAIGSAFAAKKVLELGKAAISVASDLTEVQNVVDTTFGTEGAIRVNEWARNAAEAFGESELQAKQFTSTLGAMFKSMGVGQQDMEEMSLQLAGLAGDMASFYNLDPEEAFEKLRSGISGETEPLKQLGINMSVVNLEAFAMSEGITKSYDSMTQAEQATLRYQYIMSTTADAQGDFADTSDSLANQQRILQLEIQTLAAEIGEDLMPAAKEIVSATRDAVEWATEHKGALEALAAVVVLAATGYVTWKATLKAEELYDSATKGVKALTTAISGAEGLSAALGGANTAAGGMGTLLQGAFGPAGWAVVAAVAGIGLIAAAVNELKEAQEEAMQKQVEYMDGLTSLADLRANGDLRMSGGTYNEETKMWEGVTTSISSFAQRDIVAGTYQNAARSDLGAAPGRKSYTIGELVASRHQSGEDFVMSDWTPAYLDYGERVLTAAENAEYTAMGGVEGMERRMTSGGSGGISAPSKMEVGIKVLPREMAHAITPYVIRELQAQGKWWEDDR